MYNSKSMTMYCCSFIIVILAVVAMVPSVTSFTSRPRNILPSTYTSSTSSSSTTVYATSSRRDIFTRTTSAIVGTTLLTFNNAYPAAAAGTSQVQKDKDNIVKGYNRLQYLLDNWESETTICKTGQETTFGDRCERTPTKVMEYLGFKSIDDPLFKADATMMRLKDIIPSDREVEFYEAIDAFSQNAEEANSMAFVSSWGEANPGGGKDRVRLFIERSKNNVIVSRDSLKTVMDMLDLKP